MSTCLLAVIISVRNKRAAARVQEEDIFSRNDACKTSNIEGHSGPRKDAEGFMQGVRGSVFCVIRI